MYHALMRRAGILAIVLAVGCGHSAPKPAQSAATGDRKTEVLVGPEATRDGAVVLAAWVAYGAQKAMLFVAHPPPPANQSADDFDLEIGAREMQSSFWSEQRQKGAPPHAALDRQVDIWRAGLLPEMVVLINARPGWTIPSAKISSFRFEQFSKRFGGDYKSNAPVALKPSSGKLVPDEPGADFPDPERLPIGPRACSEAVGERQAAWQRWALVEPQLGGWPVAAADRVNFAHQLVAAKGDPAFNVTL